jgi:hypothetical protein
MKKITFIFLLSITFFSYGQLEKPKFSRLELSFKGELNNNKLDYKNFQNIKNKHSKIINPSRKNIPNSIFPPIKTNKNRNKIKQTKKRFKERIKLSSKNKSNFNYYKTISTSTLEPIEKLEPIPGQSHNDVYGNRLDSVYQDYSIEKNFYYDDNTLEYQIIYEFNDDGSLDGLQGYAYDYYYNNNGDLDAILEYDYDETNDNFNPYYLTEIGYNSDNISVFTYYYDESIGGNFPFEPNSKEVYVYDNNRNNIDISYYYNWSVSEESFKINYRYSYYYVNDKLNETYLDNWNNNQSEYENSFANSYLYYEGTNQLKQNTTYDWSLESQEFSPDYAQIFEYFDNKSIKGYTDYDYDKSTQEFIPSFSTYFDEMTETNTNISTKGDNYYWDSNFDRWESEEDNLNIYYTKKSTLGVNDHNLIKVSIYPNPVTDKLFIKGITSNSKILIYNYLGNLVMSKTNSDDVEVKKLASGIYIIKIIDTKGETVRKFIKN